MSIQKYNTFFIINKHKNPKKKKRRLKIGNKLLYSKDRLLTLIGLGILLSIMVIGGIKLSLTNWHWQLHLLLSSEKHQKNSFTNQQTVRFIEQYTPEIEEENLTQLSEKAELKGLNYYEISPSQERLDLERLNLKYQQTARDSDLAKISGILNAGETLYEHLVKAGLSPSEIIRLANKLQSIVDINRLNIGTRFAVHYNGEGKIVQFDYQPNQLDAYYIKIPNNELGNIEVCKEEIFREIVCIEGVVESSLYQAMMDHYNSAQLAVQLAEIFAWDIDFLTECQPGDTFKLLVERLFRGDFYRWGDILAAVYKGEMLSTHTAVLFQDPDGKIDYYDKDGRCLRKAFLRAPLNYKYISSYYTENRYHPILRIWRPHLAIDYAAPTGTPVVSIGAGTVISKYYDKGGYGNYIEIRHPNGYVTGYGHLSKFASGLKVGSRVEQGEIIGYVGATGLATGPHLDFSISKDGKRINFLQLELPPAHSVSKEYWEDFELVKKNYLSILKEEL